MSRSSAVVFGGTSGIGRACAAALAPDALVTVVGRDAARAAAAADAIGHGAQGRAVDAADEAAVERFFAAMPPPAHVVISLAGGSAMGRFVDVDPDAMRRSLDTKLFGYLTVARQALRVLSSDGSLTFVTGGAGLRPSPGAACLAIANAAIHGLVETLARESAPIRVNAVAPGTTDTPAWSRMPEAVRASMFTAMAEKSPLGRIAQPQDVADLVLSLVRQNYLTGLIIPCDGGMRLT